MKTHTIKTPTAELLILEWQDDYEIVGKVLFGNSKQKGVLINLMNLDGYTLLGKPHEISEEDAEQLVEWGDADPSGDRFIIGYRSYFDGYKDDVPQFTCKTPIESLFSLIESEIYWENPLANEIHAPDIEEWHEAEQKTFDRKRSLIFKKNK